MDDGVEPVSDGQDGAIPKLVTYRLLDEAVGSKDDRGNTTPQWQRDPLLPGGPGAGI